jgi:hypothetical protein
VEATSKEEIEEVVMKANKRKKYQAQNTPFMQEHLASEVGWTGVGEAAQNILNGTYSPLGHLTTFTLYLISDFKPTDKAKLDNPDYTITPKLWTDYWLSARERTLSASEILHFGVFKAGAHNKTIAEFDARMTNATMQSGFSPQRWCVAIAAMLTNK